MLKYALIVLGFFPQGEGYDYSQVKVATFSHQQACIEAQVDYLNRGESATCNFVLPNGTVVPRGKEPYKDANGLWSVRNISGHDTEVIGPSPFNYQPDILIQVQ